MIVALIEHLRTTQNADGGWGAVRARQSNTEATALATLAMGQLGEPERASAERGRTWLRQRQLGDGSWPVTAASATGSWTTSFAVMALAREADAAPARRGARWLLGHRGNDLGWLYSLLYRIIPERLPTRLNPDLKGWAWTDNEFSWVEPTAYALMALKKLGRDGVPGAGSQISEAERMLYDRVCPDGGWNHGNSWVYGVPLPSYLETTAVALIALQDHRDDARTRAALEALRRMLADARSGLGLSWSIICLALHGDDAQPWRRRLADVHGRTGFLGETKPVALALLAAADGAGAFRLA